MFQDEELGGGRWGVSASEDPHKLLTGSLGYNLWFTE